MDTDELYDLVTDAVRQGIEEAQGGTNARISKRMVGGIVTFEDGDGRPVKEVPAEQLFKKVTGVREKLRVLEQKLNNHKTLSVDEKAELQVYITRCYGSLTTFNFLFREEGDKFKGTGG